MSAQAEHLSLKRYQVARDNTRGDTHWQVIDVALGEVVAVYYPNHPNAESTAQRFADRLNTRTLN